MKMDTASKAEVTRNVKMLFGGGLWTREGRYVHVHLDGADEAVRTERVDSFVPGMFFDENCPHCRPFLDDGAFVVHNGIETVAVRPLGDGMYETVVFPSQVAAQAN